MADNFEKSLDGAYEIFKAEADCLLRNGNFRTAIHRYTTALNYRHDDRVSLVCRSKCYLMLGDTNRALQDAEASLAENKNYYLGIFQKAEALFSQGDFEMALVFYHRGNKLRPEYHNFRLGIQKAQESIRNCVGTPDRIKLSTSGDLSFFAANIEKKRKRKGELCTQTPPIVQRGKRPSEKRGNEKTIKQMLGDLYGDRKFLEKILTETDNKTITGKRVNHFAEDGLTYLDNLAEFLQQVKPIYARKYERRLALNRGRTAKILPHDYIHNEIEKVEQMMTDENYEGALQKSHKIMGLLNGYTETLLSSKMTFSANLHSIMGNAYMELEDFENAVKHHLQDLAIGEERVNEQAESRALDNLGRVYAKNGHFQKAIEVLEKKLPMSKSELETSWLCLELGRSHLELGTTRLAKEYGERSLTAAERARDDNWRLHAFVLISEADVKSGRLSSALISFEKALELATLLKDAEAVAAIQTAIAEVNDQISAREISTGMEHLNDLLSFTNTDDEVEVINKSTDPEGQANPLENQPRQSLGPNTVLLSKSALIPVVKESAAPGKTENTDAAHQ